MLLAIEESAVARPGVIDAINIDWLFVIQENDQQVVINLLHRVRLWGNWSQLSILHRIILWKTCASPLTHSEWTETSATALQPQRPRDGCVTV